MLAAYVASDKTSGAPPVHRHHCESAVRIFIAFLIVGLSLVEPLTHLWIAYAPPEGTVPTGLHTGDSSIYLHSMASFANGFHSPFTTCHAEYGPDSFRYYAPPYFLLYGVVGWLGRLTGIPPFLFLGLANGVGGALYLWAAYRFLREVWPRLANRAFLLFAFPGGLGGVLFLITWAVGWHAHPQFTQYFERFAHYELIEGQHLSPVLLMPRLYYTLPLAVGLTGLTFFLHAARRGDQKALLLAGLLNGLTTAVNFRIGPLLWVVECLYLACDRDLPLRRRVAMGLTTAVPTAVGGIIFFGFLQLPPVFTENAVFVTRMALWLIPFLILTAFHWLFLPGALLRGLRAFPTWLRFAACGVAGYLATFTLLYLGYQAYYGNWLVGGDTSATVAMSDWALAGVIVGLVSAYFVKGKNAPETEGDPVLAWTSLWFLLFLALAVSAFGNGWFLRFTPQRLMILMALPLALLTAAALDRLRPALRATGLGLLLAFGLCSTAVAALCFQGPFARNPGTGPFAYLHYEVMRPAEAQLLDALPTGTVAVPPWSPIAFGEIVALRPGMQVLGGPGLMNLGDQPFGTLQQEIEVFFQEETDRPFREEFIRRWCVDAIYCPDTCPVADAVLEALRQMPDLEEALQAGNGAVFLVRKRSGPKQPMKSGLFAL